MSRLIDLAIRLAGGEPAVVRPLVAAMRKDAIGTQEILRHKNPGRFTLTAEGAHVLTLVLAALGSIGLMLGVILLGQQGRVAVAAILLAAVHALFLGVGITGQAVPALLCDDDARILGWWPVGRRDVMLARLGTVLVPNLQITGALAGLPLAVYAFLGPVPAAAALLLAAALVMQLLAMAMAAAGGTALVLRLAGPRRARRLASLVVDGNLGTLPFLGFLFAEHLVAFFKAHPGILAWLPPAWYAAWGDPAGGPAAWRGMALSLGLTVLLGTVGWRLVAPRGGTPAPSVVQAPGRVHRHWSDLVLLVLRPWLRDREGWVTGRLLAAHLREDWRFGGNMLFGVVMTVAMLWFYTRPRGDDFEALGAMVLGGSQILMLLAISMPFYASFSSTPRALWVVALADLDAVRLLAAQRTMTRALFVAPVLVGFVARALVLGLAWWQALGLAGIMGLEAELLMMLGQRILPLMSFSRAFTRDQSSQAVIRAFAMMGAIVAVGVVNALAAFWSWALIADVVVMPALVYAMSRILARHVAGSRLNFGEIAT